MVSVALASEQPSHRQLTILSMCASGYSREEIGRELIISPWTVKFDLDELRGLIGARNVTHAVAICLICGYLRVDRLHGVTAVTDERMSELAIEVLPGRRIAAAGIAA